MTHQEKAVLIEHYAKENHIPYFSSYSKEHKLPKIARRYIATSYIMFDLSKIQKGLYFIFFDSYTGGTHRSSGWGDTFCGLFKEIDDFEANLTIKERHWLDQLSFKNRYLCNNRHLDQQLSIYSDSKIKTHDFLSNRKLRHFLDMKKIMPALKVETETEAWNIIPEFEQKNIISICTNQWLTNSAKINWFITHGCRYLY